MYISNDTKKIKEFKDYCVNNFPKEDATKNYNLFGRTVLELDIETNIINTLKPTRVYKSYGDYLSNTLIILEEYDKGLLKLLDDILSKINNQNTLDMCIVYRKKADIDFDTVVDNKNSTEIYNNLLYKELKVFNPKYMLNFSKLKIEDNYINSKIFNLGYKFIYTLNELFYKEARTKEELKNVKLLTGHLYGILKTIYTKEESDI